MDYPKADKLFEFISADPQKRGKMLADVNKKDDRTILWVDHDCHLSPEDGCEFCAEWQEMTQEEKEKLLEEELRHEEWISHKE